VSHPSDPPTRRWTAAAGPDEVIVGEAVALELRLARLPSRALALALDLCAMGGALLIAALLVEPALSAADDALAAAIVLSAIALVVIGYPVTFETLTRGRSPGKIAVGLRVVRDDGGPIRFRHALTRALVGVFVDFNPIGMGAPAVISSLISARAKRVGDLLAGTVVLRERVPAPSGGQVLVPGHLAGWAAGLPVERLPDGLALQARTLLSRLRELDPVMAAHWAGQLAAEVTGVLGVSPPPGVDPVSTLAAVLAERHRRDLVRTHPAPPPTRPFQPAPPSAGPPEGPFAPPG